MAKTLTDAQQKIAMAWMHDILVWGGVIKTPKRAIPASDYYYTYGGRHHARANNSILPSVQYFCKAIKERRVETQYIQQLDSALNRLADYRFIPDLAETSNWGKACRKAPDMLARYLAWFCKNNQLWWDNSATTTYEMEQIRDNTMVGKALWDEGCFTSQDDSVQKISTPRAASSGTPGQPQNGFKARGPLSGVCIDLKSTPNKKEFLSGDVFVILGVDANGNFMEDCAYVRPVEADSRIQQQYVSGGTNIVLFGSAKGYGYCPCTFASNTDADAFLLKLKQNVKPGKASDMKVGKKHAQGNGYFRVGTVYGECYISAAKLNEDLQEDVSIKECGLSKEIQEQLDEMIREDNQFERDYLSD